MILIFSEEPGYSFEITSDDADDEIKAAREELEYMLGRSLMLDGRTNFPSFEIYNEECELVAAG